MRSDADEQRMGRTGPVDQQTRAARDVSSSTSCTCSVSSWWWRTITCKFVDDEHAATAGAVESDDSTDTRLR